LITEFTPWASLGGGALIGLASVLLMALHGRIMGAMGLVGGVLRLGNWPDWALRAAILAGMASGPLVILLVTGQAAALDVPVSSLAMVVSGLIVGVGATFGGGCTSGHGICGNARFSRRSLVATVTFMVTTFATVFVIRHVIGG
jgi:uncharacterized protein